MRLASVIVCSLLFITAGSVTARPAMAQESKPDPGTTKPVAPATKNTPVAEGVAYYVHASVGAQVSSRDLVARGTVPMFDETASFETRGETGGGLLVDVGGAYRVWRRLYGGVSYTWLGGDVGGPLTGQVPDTLRFDTFRPISGTVSGLSHTEHAVHLQAVWRHPVNNRIDVGVSLGPTIFSVSQELVSNLSITGTEANVSLAGVTTEKVSDSAVGFHIGVDGTYTLTHRLAAGAFLRYAGGSVDLPGSAGSVPLDTGGVQIGVGVRLRFR